MSGRFWIASFLNQYRVGESDRSQFDTDFSLIFPFVKLHEAC